MPRICPKTIVEQLFSITPDSGRVPLNRRYLTIRLYLARPRHAPCVYKSYPYTRNLDIHSLGPAGPRNPRYRTSQGRFGILPQRGLPVGLGRQRRYLSLGSVGLVRRSFAPYPYLERETYKPFVSRMCSCANECLLLKSIESYMSGFQLASDERTTFN